MPATAERRRSLPRTLSADPVDLSQRQFDDEGFEIRHELVDGEWVPFSLKPFADTERSIYWNPCGPMEMAWRSPYKNDMGFQPIIQKESWTDGWYSPRNAWEEHMTREWMKKSIPGAGNPDQFKGNEYADDEFRCGTCTWHSGNRQAFRQHCRYLGHREALLD